MTAEVLPVAGELRGVRRSVGALAAGEAVNKLARFAAAIVLARALSLEEFGLLNIGIALGGIAAVLMRLGLPDLGTRDVAAAPERAAELAGRIVAPQALGMVLLTLVAAAVVAVVDGGAVPFTVMAGASMFGLSLSADWLLRGQERMGAVAVASALGGVVVLVAAICVTSFSDAATAALAAFAFGELVAAAATWRATGLARRVRPTLDDLRPLLRRAWPLAASGIVVYTFYANIDTLILGATRSTEEAGLYSGPYRVFLALNAIVLFAAQSLLPVVTRATLGTGGAERAAGVLRGAMRPLLIYGLLCLAGAELLGRPALGFLFGESFKASDSTLILLCVAIPWYAVGFPAGYALIASEHLRDYLRGAAVAGAAGIVLNFALIPPLGAPGAALATALAFAAAAIVWLERQRLLAAARRALAGLALASAGAGVAALAPETAAAIGAATLVAVLALVVAEVRAR